MKYPTIIALCLVSSLAHARDIRVRLEPFPPLVREDGGGLLVEMLERVAREHELSLDIRILSYSRSKYELRNGEADLIAPVPLGRETGDFYSYARELDWRLDTRADLFSYSPELLDGDDWRARRVGTPWGNAPFFSELTGVELNAFVESSLGSLARMLRSKRIKAVLFERVSTMTTIRELDLEGIHYRNLFRIPAGLAVADTKRGRALQKQLEPLLTNPEELPRFEQYLEYTRLPERGRVDGQLLEKREQEREQEREATP